MRRKNVVTVSAGRFVSAGKVVRGALEQALVFLGKRNVALEVNLVTRETLRALNRDCRGVDRLTSVLSFRLGSTFPTPQLKGNFLGEIFLAPQCIQEKGEDIVLLALHGLLHLLGYTHERKSDSIEMERREKELTSHLHI